MRKNQVKAMAAGVLVLALVAGCGSNNNDINRGKGSITSMDIDNIGHNAGEPESRTETGAGEKETSSQSQTQENGQFQTQESSQSHSQFQDTGDTGNTEKTASTEDIEEELAAYRAEREKGISSIRNYMLVQLPNEENYNYGVGDISYLSRFDSRELNEAFKAAGAYVKDTLNLEGEAWICVDPRMTAIYEDDDKGVANGYDADNIFLCEYNDNGNWQYLILVREGKGADWKALYHGSSYKTD